MTRRTRPRSDPRRARFHADLASLTPNDRQQAVIRARMARRSVATRRATQALSTTFYVIAFAVCLGIALLLLADALL